MENSIKYAHLRVASEPRERRHSVADSLPLAARCRRLPLDASISSFYQILMSDEKKSAHHSSMHRHISIPIPTPMPVPIPFPLPCTSTCTNLPSFLPTYIHTYIQSYIHTYVRTCVRSGVYVRTYVLTHHCVVVCSSTREHVTRVVPLMSMSKRTRH